jgi:mono/diheme cytochrome c family protein
MRGKVLAITQLLLVGSFLLPRGGAADAANSDLDRTLAQTVRPFLASYCVGCHGGAAPAAQFDLGSYSTMAAVIRDYPRWNLVLEKLTAREMPPKVAPQPPDAARQEVIDWVQAVRMSEARKNAGDPGPVLVRRLSNAEYNNTIRDLTGVDMRPTREFPVDPANTAGFDNSGESLAMSPALLNKYLQAAREVGDHMVLTPDGFDFAPHPMLVETDRDRYAIQRIIGFYERQPTDYADYFQAAWRFKYRSAPGTPGATLADIAAQSKVSAKYLPMIWGILEETSEAGQEVGPIATLQAMWRALPRPRGNQLDPEVRAACIEMRDFVVRIRQHTAMAFAAPVVRGLPAGSQPLLNWKLRAFNSHRRDSDPKALRNDTDPPPVLPEIPKYPGLHQEAAYHWAALTARARAGDPDLVVPAAERARYQTSFERFASVFPDAFYVKERGRFFPDDSQDKGRLLSAGYHNVMGYWRDDTPLMELILDAQGQNELNSLWDQFDFIAAHTARTWDQYYFNQSGEVQGKGAESGTLRPEDKAVSSEAVIFGLRDAYIAKAQASDNPIATEAIRYHFQWVNDTLRRMERMHVEAEPRQLDALLQFASRAYRRPLSPPERDDLLSFYHTLREKSGLTHEEAVRDSIVRVLMSPKFGYRVDLLDDSAKSAPAPVSPLSPYALASRLSYFLWSSMPDEQLLDRAQAGDLQKPDVLAAQARRMLKDDRASGLALEFAGNWLDFRRFEEHNAVDRERFPSFTNDLREAMFQEPVRFFEDVIRNDRSVLDMLYGNYTFVNPLLAIHYGMPEVTGGPDHWVRVDDARLYGRGGLLPMSVFLTQNAPGLRTSPVKRGYWVVRRVLGETIPSPPPNVPELPQDEAKLDLPLREVLAQHRANPACAACHARFDSLGLAFEAYGPIGEKRSRDLAGHPVDTQAVFPGGIKGDGFAGVLDYIREHRQKDFTGNLSRKLLSFALGRSLQLSDEPLIEQIQTKLTADGYRFTPLVEMIVTSPQFLNKRRTDPPVQTARKGE